MRFIGKGTECIIILCECCFIGKDSKWECLSLIGLGKCFAKLDRLDRAIENHESILNKAQENGLRDIVFQVSTELIDIYSQMASHYENKDDEESTTMALRYLEKCLEVNQ